MVFFWLVSAAAPFIAATFLFFVLPALTLAAMESMSEEDRNNVTLLLISGGHLLICRAILLFFSITSYRNFNHGLKGLAFIDDARRQAAGDERRNEAQPNWSHLFQYG